MRKYSVEEDVDRREYVENCVAIVEQVRLHRIRKVFRTSVYLLPRGCARAGRNGR